MCYPRIGIGGIAIVHNFLGHLSVRLADTVAGLLSQFIYGLVSLRTPTAYIEILGSSLLLNLVYVSIVWFSFATFGFHSAPWHLGGRAGVVVMAISTIGVVVPTPGGIGSYHFFFGNSLYKLFAVPLAPALACATVLNAVTNLTYFAIGVPALLVQRRSHRERAQNLRLVQAPSPKQSSSPP